MSNPNQCPRSNSERDSVLRAAIYDNPNEKGLLARSLSQLQARIVFGESIEASEIARGDIKGVETIGHNQPASFVRLFRKSDGTSTVIVSNEENVEGDHEVEFSGIRYCWSGPFSTEELS